MSSLKVEVTTKPTWDTSRQMDAVEFLGKHNVKSVKSPIPRITEPKDAIVKITLAAICGSDLHLYHNEIKMNNGDILGHEGVGIIEEVGSEVKDFKVGDRVVVSAIIACGLCNYCKRQEYSLCDSTNPSKEMEDQYGHRTAGIFGYSPLTGAYPGCQAEFVRVPLADVNLLKIPDEIKDEQAIFLSDVYCTSWHANELGGVTDGSKVAIWGLGPVGMMTAVWAKYRGAERIVCIDCVPHRLQIAKDKGFEVIDISEKDIVREMHRLIPDGPDVCIDCAGFRYTTSLLHKIERALYLESDAPQILSECIYLVRKGGTIVLIGDYFQKANHFPVGALMEKSITLKGGQVFVQKYWKHLLEILKEGKADPTFMVTHIMPLEKAELAYNIFDKKENNSIKILLNPQQKPT